jgi:hypothetical protein
MAEKRKLEFFVLRYVPDAVKGESVNFGLVTFAEMGDRPEVIDVRFTRDRGRLLCLDPQADLDVLDGLQRELQHEIGQVRDQAALLRRIEDSFSNAIQMSAVLPALTRKQALDEIEDVARIFLESPKVKRTHEPAGRRKILEIMRDEFDKARVLTLMNAVPVAPYTKPGDPFEFDFGYRVRNEIKLFHAVSLRASVDPAVMLAARYPKIAPVMEKVAGAAPLLTAVVDAGLDRSRSEVGFALEMMEESRIRVADATEMNAIAETARRELEA